MPEQFRVGVIVPVATEAAAALVTQRLQEATTIRTHIGAWVVRKRDEDPFVGEVLVDFTIQAETPEEARAQALAWTRKGLSRGDAIEGAGEPVDAGTTF